MASALLPLCLRITGTFENGTPQYDGITGNFDGQGISVGILSFAAGQGTLQILLKRIAAKVGWPALQTFFKSDIQAFSEMSGAAAVGFCKLHYLRNGSNFVDPAAVTAWKGLLSLPASVESQNELAEERFLTPAIQVATEFCPDYSECNRVITFFFDLLVQEGSMKSVRPVTAAEAQYKTALAYAATKNAENAALWSSAAKDGLTQLLIHYAYQRALLANPTYLYDAFSRRATIAARSGWVHGEKVDFTTLLD